MNKRWLVASIAILIVITLLVFIGLNKKRGSLLLLSNIKPVSSLLTQAKELEAKGNILEAKDVYQRLINEFPNSNEVMNWQKKNEELNIKLLFSSTITPKSILYQIKPGDTLTKIAKEFNTTPELIMKSNHLADDKILPGRKIKVWTQAFSIVVDKSQNTLILKTDEEIIILLYHYSQKYSLPDKAG